MRGKELIANEKGMTLVELAVTLAIAGILATLALPNFIGVMPRIRLSSEATTLGSEVALSRARAISKNQEFRLSFDTVNDSYTLGLCVDDETPPDGCDGGDTWRTITTNNMPADIDLYEVGIYNSNDTIAAQLEADTVIIFRSVGTTRRTNGDHLGLGQTWRFYLQTDDAAYRKRILVEASGRVRTQRWTGGAGWKEN